MNKLIQVEKMNLIQLQNHQKKKKENKNKKNCDVLIASRA